MDHVKLELEVAERSEPSTLPGVRLVAKPRSALEGEGLSLTESCKGVDELERAVSRLKDQMDRLMKEAGALFARRTETPREAPQTPGTLWAAMETDNSLEGMQRLFNGLDVEKRQELANHIFTHANIFKGAASLFSQHYNEDTSTLE